MDDDQYLGHEQNLFHLGWSKRLKSSTAPLYSSKFSYCLHFERKVSWVGSFHSDNKCKLRHDKFDNVQLPHLI